MKAQCAVCGFEAHDLKPHFVNGRNAACSVTLEEYLVRYPGRRVVSELFEEKLQELREKSTAEGMNLTVKTYSIKETFGMEMGSDEVIGFVERTKFVPEIDPNYTFPEEATKIVLLGLQTNKPTLVHGPTGSGKSTLIEQIAARINYPAIRINHHADMYSSDIVGQKKVIDGQTLYEYGPLPFAMGRPMILILDEWDALNPEIALQYQAVLERKHDGRLGSLLLTANENEKMESNRFFRIVATSNTCGLGDDKGHYQGTQLQNLAFISRFLLRVKLDYMDPEHEAKLLKTRFPELEQKEAKSLVKVAKLVRERYEAGELNVPYSVRDLINWTDLYLMIGDPQKAMTYTCTSVLPFSDSKLIGEIVQRVFGE
jgi:cobaltochelatase CobS